MVLVTLNEKVTKEIPLGIQPLLFLFLRIYIVMLLVI